MKKNIIFILLVVLLSCNFKTNDITKIEKAKTIFFICDTSKYKIYNYFPKNKLGRYQKEISKFEKEDSINFPAKNSVLFVGSSSIRKWKNLKEDFSPIAVINRGFGGSTFPELIYYSDKLIFKYQPQIIVIYEGDNDQYFLKPLEIIKNVCYLEKIIHKKLPNSKVFFLSVKPSPARRNKLKSMLVTNIYLQRYAEETPNTYFLNIWDKMFDKKGKIKSDIFLSDSLHMNTKGYQIWTSVIKPKIEIYYNKL